MITTLYCHVRVGFTVQEGSIWNCHSLTNLNKHASFLKSHQSSRLNTLYSEAVYVICMNLTYLYLNFHGHIIIHLHSDLIPDPWPDTEIDGIIM